MSTYLFAEISGCISHNDRDGLYIGNVKDIVGKYGLMMYYKILAINQ